MRPCLTLNFTSILNMTFEFYPQDIDKAWKDLEQAEKDFQDWILSQLRKYVNFSLFFYKNLNLKLLLQNSWFLDIPYFL